MAERGDRLRLAILKDCESVPVEVGDHALFVVDHGGVQHNFLDVVLKDEAPAFGAGFLARRWFLIRRRCLAGMELRQAANCAVAPRAGLVFWASTTRLNRDNRDQPEAIP